MAYLVSYLLVGSFTLGYFQGKEKIDIWTTVPIGFCLLMPPSVW